MTPPIVLLVNPAAGSGRAKRVRDSAVAALQRAGTVEVHESQGPRDETRVAREAAQANARALVVLGGDGGPVCARRTDGTGCGAAVRVCARAGFVHHKPSALMLPWTSQAVWDRFFITELGFYHPVVNSTLTDYSDGSFPANRYKAVGRQLTYQFGAMSNRGLQSAIGGTVLLGFGEGGAEFGLLACYRRRLSADGPCR